MADALSLLDPGPATAAGAAHGQLASSLPGGGLAISCHKLVEDSARALVLLAPGRWLFGDVRWALTAWTLAGAGLLLALGRWRRPAAWAAAATLLLVPGTTTQVEQSWTEPLLLALLAAWALLVSRDRA